MSKSAKSFLLAPSESLLIGCSLEEYFLEYEDVGIADFMDIVKKRIEPFIPNLAKFGPSNESFTELPNDIAWCRIDDEQWGMSPSFPTTVFLESSHGIKPYKWSTPRKSLIDLLINYLDGVILKSYSEELRFPSSTSEALERHSDYIAYWLENDLDSPSAFVSALTSRGNDCEDHRQIEARLVDLARDQKCEVSFRLGRICGALLAECRRHEYTLHVLLRHWIEDDSKLPDRYKLRTTRQQLLSNVSVHLKQLLDSALLRSFAHSSLLVRYELSRIERILEKAEYEDAPLSSDRAVEDLQKVTQIVWTVMGEGFGYLRAADREVFEADVKSLYPRAFVISPTASPSAVGGQLHLIESLLSDQNEADVAPGQFIHFCSNAIEALARSLWPSDFVGPARDSKLIKTLDTKAHKGTDLEQRFAKLAKVLHSQYRNPTSHDPENFHCTWNEARMFFLGIRSLNEMADQMKTQDGQ